MTPRILSPELQQQHEALRALLQRALWLAEKCADHEATTILRARLTNLQSAALLVILGEVKAGKSSFINALVKEDVCQVAPGPCTTDIQELVYGPERSVVNLGQAWDRVYLPKEVLREVTIVDTPGTNSIIQNHQAITENYIPQSDLVVFVFSAVNPHTKTAWEFLNKVRKEWHRKIIFVLQQADRASPQELATNCEHVKQYARERHVDNPVVFPLSAKRELEGAPMSGLPEFRNFLDYGIRRGEVWRTKVEGSYQTIRTVMSKVLTRLREEQASIAEERAFYQELLRKVEASEARAKSMKGLIVDKISGSYDRLSQQSEADFAERLNVGTVLRGAIPASRENEKGHFSGNAAASTKEMAMEAPRLSQELLLEMQNIMDELTESIAVRRERAVERGVLPQAEHRLALLEKLKTRLESQRVGEIAEAKLKQAAEVKRSVFTGAALVLVGIAILALSRSVWLTVAGALCACTGVVLIVVGVLWRRSDILRDVRQKLGESRKQFRLRLQSEISQVFDGLLDEVRHDLTETIFRLDVQSSQITPLLDETFKIGEVASEMILRSRQMVIAQPGA
jgi:GTP-binding protein EngB required for normal cell division